MDRAERQAEVEYLAGCFTKSQIVLCADYRGLTVGQVTGLRKELKKSGATAQVVKNKLGHLSLKKAKAGNTKDAEIEKFRSVLKGPSLVIFADDPVGPAKALAQFKKANEIFTIKGALFEGAFIDPAGVDVLSKMPGRAETLAGLLRLINGPATQLARLLSAPSGQVVRVLEAQRQNLEKKAA